MKKIGCFILGLVLFSQLFCCQIFATNSSPATGWGKNIANQNIHKSSFCVYLETIGDVTCDHSSELLVQSNRDDVSFHVLRTYNVFLEKLLRSHLNDSRVIVYKQSLKVVPILSGNFLKPLKNIVLLI